MTRESARLSLAFSCVGHTYSHLYAPIFYVAVLALETDMSLSHGEAIGLIVVGNVLFGVAAPVAGWLGDRWSAVGMMALFYLGTGGGMLLTGAAASPWTIGMGLAVTGLFASIYHPVGMAWLVRHARNRATALGVNGLFGGLGPVPGALVLVTGGVFIWALARGVIKETRTDRHQVVPPTRRDAVRAFAVLSITMLCIGLIYQATQAGLPKLFSVRLGDIAADGVFGVSALVGVVYLTAGTLQIFAGRLADRYPLRTVYLAAFSLQAPFLFLAGQLGGGGLLTRWPLSW